MVKDFGYFLRRGDVKRQSPDRNLSVSALKGGLERLELSRELLAGSKPKYALENAYEAMREAADALLYLEGYKSFSHEVIFAGAIIGKIRRLLSDAGHGKSKTINSND